MEARLAFCLEGDAVEGDRGTDDVACFGLRMLFAGWGDREIRATTIAGEGMRVGHV